MTHPEDLLRRIRLGEDSLIEFKRVFLSGDRVTDPKRADFADELTGMANGAGGTVVLGVEDRTREIVGIPLDRLDAVEAWTREICNDSITPPLDAVIRKMELPGISGAPAPVICVDVPRSLFVHRSQGGYFLRIGRSKREMAPDALARLFQERSQSRVIRFDESPVPNTSPDDLDDALTARFLRQDAPVSEDMLRKLRVVAEDELGAPRITVAGALLCCAEPGRWMPHAYIQAVRYAGERRDVNYQLDAQDFAGPLDAQALDALSFVRRNTRVAATKAVARRDVPQFSLRAVFEALVNAVAHRDYSIAGARIRLYIFGGRLELYVPGALANTLAPDIMRLRQYSRNELIVSLLARCPVPGSSGAERSRMMERRGDGVPIILDESRELSGREPLYELIDDNELRLTIWAAEA